MVLAFDMDDVEARSRDMRMMETAAESDCGYDQRDIPHTNG